MCHCRGRSPRLAAQPGDAWPPALRFPPRSAPQRRPCGGAVHSLTRPVDARDPDPPSGPPVQRLLRRSVDGAAENVNDTARNAIGTSEAKSIRETYGGKLSLEPLVRVLRGTERIFPTRLIARGPRPHPLASAARSFTGLRFDSRGTEYA